MIEARLSTSQIAALRSRWTQAEIELANAALRSGDLDSLPRLDSGAAGLSFYDLRGLLLTTPVVGQNLTHLDLSYSYIP